MASTNPIPREHRPDEFYLRISYRPTRHTGGLAEGELPGFYLEAGAANEGTGYSFLGAGYNNGSPERKRLGHQALQNVLTVLAEDPNVPSELMNLGGPLNGFAEDALRKRQAAMIRQVRTLREQLAAAEAALEAEGLPRDT